MPAAVDHILLTRFSAVLRPGAEPMPESWLRYRLGFFYDACLPSVLRQRGAGPFRWLVLFDDRCPEDFREDVEDLAHEAFTPIWTHEPFRRDSFAAPVAAVSDAAYLLTTRIDSDDAMAVDFMAAVQREFGCEERLFVNFPAGLQIDRGGGVYRSRNASSPFLSLIERRVPGRLPDTVYAVPHARARRHAPVRQVPAPPMWIQVVHGLNLANIVNGGRVDPQVVSRRFDFDLGYDAQVSGLALRRAQLAQARRVARLWGRHPGEFTAWLEGRATALRGTHEREQDDGRTFTDRVQDWERRTGVRWRSSGTRERVRAGNRAVTGGRWRLAGRVNALLAGPAQVLAGDLPAVLAADRVVVLAEWSRSRRLRPDALAAARAWVEAGYAVLLVAARDPWRGLRVGSLPARTAVLRRGNVGYDFGSWGEALTAFPQLTAARWVVLTNDSLVGPLGPLDELVRRMESSGAHVWGPTLNRQPAEHLQSYLLGFAGGVLARPELRDFFAGILPQDSKRGVILRYELGLTRLVDELGLRRAPGWTHEELGLWELANPPVHAWGALLERGFPFVKRVLLTGRDFETVRSTVEQVVRERRWSPPAAG